MGAGKLLLELLGEVCCCLGTSWDEQFVLCLWSKLFGISSGCLCCRNWCRFGAFGGVFAAPAAWGALRELSLLCRVWGAGGCRTWLKPQP